MRFMNDQGIPNAVATPPEVSPFSIAGTAYSNVFDITSGVLLAVTCKATVGASTAKTFASGSAGTLLIQDLTYTDAVRRATSPVTIAYTAGGTAGAEVVTVVGNAISIQIETAVSTADAKALAKAEADAKAKDAEIEALRKQLAEANKPKT